MKSLIRKLFTLIDQYGLSSNNYPSYLENGFQIAIQAKRNGDYEKSLSLIIRFIEDECCAYTGLLNGAFKTIAAAGYLNDTIKLLKMCDKEMRNNRQAMMLAQMGIPNNFQDHLMRIKQAIGDEYSLRQYLSSISGNPYYSLPRAYSDILSELYKNINE